MNQIQKAKDKFLESSGLKGRYGETMLDDLLEAMREMLIGVASTHDEGDGAYCDTGEDMEWACRSECVEKAVERMRGFELSCKCQCHVIDDRPCEECFETHGIKPKYQ